jgi:hypothetical protein
MDDLAEKKGCGHEQQNDDSREHASLLIAQVQP